MEAISNSEFLAHPEIYFEMAREQDVRIRKGGEVFHLISENTKEDGKLTEEEVLRGAYNHLRALYPDGIQMLSDEEEIARAITVDELLARIHRNIDKKWAERRR